MNREAYIDEIKLALTGFVLESELDENTYNLILDSSFREVQRYINTTSLITLPYNNCIDISDLHVDVVTNVFRTAAYGVAEQMSNVGDPVYFQYWSMLGNGSIAGIGNYAYNLGAYNQLLQIRNTTSTDLQYRVDKSQNKLYVNVSGSIPDKITIEYIPDYRDIEDIRSNYWIDILTRMSVAKAKMTVGRIRTRFGQSGALWQMDGDTILNEGKEELTALRDYLQNHTDTLLPID